MIFEVGGKKVFAATGGQPVRPERPVAVFLHGAGMDHSVWTLPGRYVAHHGGTTLALDLPGHGKSDGPALGSIAEMAEWVWRALEAQKITKAFFVGHSMGALISLEAARAQPDCVAGLLLVGFSPKMPVHPDLLDAAKRNDPKASELIASWGFGPAGQVGGNQTPGLAMLPLGLRLIQRAPAGSLHADLAACDAYRAPDAGTVKAPILLLQGTADRMTPAKGAKAFVEGVAQSDIRMLDGIGHMVMAEAPDDVTAALRDFIKA
jgi:pimeloyl-ACP methyl ester carboxylesterase